MSHLQANACFERAAMLCGSCGQIVGIEDLKDRLRAAGFDAGDAQLKAWRA